MNGRNAIKFIIFNSYLMCAMVLAAPFTVVENSQFQSHEIVVKREINEENGVLQRNNHANENDDDGEILELAATHIFRPKLQKFTNRVRKSAHTSDTYLSPYFFTVNYPITYSIDTLDF